MEEFGEWQKRRDAEAAAKATATDPFKASREALAAEAYERERVAFYSDGPDPNSVEKNRRGAKFTRLRFTNGPKLGNAQYSHDNHGRELAEIDDVNAYFIKQSGRDFEVDEDEPQGLNYLTMEQVERAYEAIMLLHCMDLGFNVWYTCTWASVELTTDRQVADAIEWQIVLLRKWLEYRGAEFHYIWVVERGRERGLHFHVLMHLPKEISFKKFERQVSQSIVTITGMYPRCPDAKPPKQAKRAKPAKPAEPSTNPFAGVPVEPIEADDTRTVKIERVTGVSSQWRLWRYLLKGIDPEDEMHVRGRGCRKCIPLARYLGLDELSHQGRYEGLRFGRSQTLGPEKQDMFAAKHRMPPNPFWTAKEPSKLYGTQFLDFAKALAKPEPEPVRVKLLDSLELPSPIVDRLPHWRRTPDD